MSFWNQNLSASAQLARVKDMTQGECARALREPETQPATKGALIRRLRMFNATRLGAPSSDSARSFTKVTSATSADYCPRCGMLRSQCDCWDPVNQS